MGVLIFRERALVRAGVLLLLVEMLGGYGMADETLLDFEGDFDFSAVEARDVRISASGGPGGAALRVGSSHGQDWPGITLKAPRGRWDLSAYDYLTLDVANAGTNDVRVCCRVDNPRADGRNDCNTTCISLKPGEKRTLKVVFRRKPPASAHVRLFGMRGYPVPQPGPGTIDPGNVTQLIIFVPKPKEDHVFEIDGICAGGAYTPPKVPQGEAFFPFIDEFGQYVHRDWPGKTHSVEDMAAQAAAEDKDLRETPGPADWDEYGGWEAGPALKATGYFRAEKYEGRWWLVDPEGKLFFSHGIDCVNYSGATPIEDRAHWFRGLPEEGTKLGKFYSRGRAIHGHYAGRRMKCFDFIRANLLRKFGPDWREESAGLTHRRLRNWGLNTIANWSDEDIYLRRKTPYVVSVHCGGKALEGSKGYWGQFRDVFDPDFEKQLKNRLAREKGKSAGDPRCIGYFVDNELSWGDEISLAVAALVSPPDQAAKKVFVNDLKKKYGTIDDLNRAWDARHASWEDLLERRDAPDAERAREDLVAFYVRTAEEYFRTCRKAVKDVAPDNLYLGCRFAWVNDRAAAVAAKYCDVVSYNLYRRSVEDFRFPGKADVPLIIGEFHFGALDRGMFHTGLVPVKDQAERARMYKEYVRGVLRHPSFVGCHWFKYRDEPTTGRPLDEENYQIGFVDIADAPYPETVEACRQVGHALYAYRLRGGM